MPSLVKAWTVLGGRGAVKMAALKDLIFSVNTKENVESYDLLM